MSYLGLLLILLSWMIQLIHFDKREKMHVIFMLSYAAGTSFLVIDGFKTQNYILGSLNLLILCVVTMVMLKCKR